MVARLSQWIHITGIGFDYIRISLMKCLDYSTSHFLSTAIISNSIMNWAIYVYLKDFQEIVLPLIKKHVITSKLRFIRVWYPVSINVSFKYWRIFSVMQWIFSCMFNDPNTQGMYFNVRHSNYLYNDLAYMPNRLYWSFTTH